MFAFAKQLVKSTAEGLINTSSDYDYPHHRQQNRQPRKPDPTHGFRVLHVVPGSPAMEAGLESVFDFIVGINGHEIVGQQPQQHAYYNNMMNQPHQQQYHPDNNYTDPQYDPQYQQHHNNGAPMQGHRNSASISFPAASLMMPQLIPPQTEIAPIEPFLTEIANCKGRSISLDVWSAKGRVRRTIVLPVPSDVYKPSASEEGDNNEKNEKQQEPEQPADTFNIGISLQWTPLSVADHVWHVLNVSPNSPAEAAGLISHSDYIVGAELGLLEQGGEDLLGRVVNRLMTNHANMRRQQQSAGLNQITEEGEEEQLDGAEQQQQQQETNTIVDSQPELELFVYNHDYNTIRPVRIRPNSHWGGSGLLGCGVGYGLLHRLPAVHSYEDEAVAAAAAEQQQSFYNHNRRASSGVPPGSTLFDTHQDSSEMFIPANMNATKPFSPQPNQQSYQFPSNPSSSSSGAIPPPPPSSSMATSDGIPPPPIRKMKPHHSESHVSKKIEDDLAAYFAEEEQKSQLVEGSHYKSSTPNTSLPPPPPPPPAS